MTDGIPALTGKEKEALRLILVGHDAKSSARELGLSVHTINERLRIARRKLAVTSSRQAARILRESETGARQNLVHEQIGDAPKRAGDEGPNQSLTRLAAGQDHRPRNAVLFGATAMTIFLAALAVIASPTPDSAADSRPAAIAANDAAVEVAAREWLALVDAGDWQSSFAATGDGFRAVNTAEGWEAASRKARIPLGAPVTRTAIAFEHLPVPPAGAQLVRFRTDFAARAGAVETLSLQMEQGRLKVVGYFID